LIGLYHRDKDNSIIRFKIEKSKSAGKIKRYREKSKSVKKNQIVLKRSLHRCEKPKIDTI